MEQADVVAELGFEVDDYFGGCPECGKQDAVLSVGRDHWAVCDHHKNKWLIGSWRSESRPDYWRKNVALLRDYVTVEPLMPTNPGVYAQDEAYQLAMSEMLARLRERRRLVTSIAGLVPTEGDER